MDDKNWQLREGDPFASPQVLSDEQIKELAIEAGFVFHTEPHLQRIGAAITVSYYPQQFKRLAALLASKQAQQEPVSGAVGERPLQNDSTVIASAREKLKAAGFKPFSPAPEVETLEDGQLWRYYALRLEVEVKHLEKERDRAALQPAQTAPHIVEALSWHAGERDDLTLDDAADVIRRGWKKVHGRTERQLVLQIAALLASQPTAAVSRTSVVTDEMVEAAEAVGDLYRMGQPELIRSAIHAALLSAPAQPTPAVSDQSEMIQSALREILASAKSNGNLYIADMAQDTLSLMGAALSAPAAQQPSDRIAELEQRIKNLEYVKQMKDDLIAELRAQQPSETNIHNAAIEVAKQYVNGRKAGRHEGGAIWLEISKIVNGLDSLLRPAAQNICRMCAPEAGVYCEGHGPAAQAAEAGKDK